MVFVFQQYQSHPDRPCLPMEQQQPCKRRRTQSPTHSPPPLLQQPQQQQQVVQHFAHFLGGNELAATLRLVSKATAAQFRRPQHMSVRLSLAVPYHAFAWRWGGPNATRSLTVRQRKQIPCLTASSGSISNLGVLLPRDDLTSPLAPAVLAAAAGAGQLEVCRWLQQQGCPLDDALTMWKAAAGGGHRAVSEWLLDEGDSPADVWAASAAAAYGGHVDLMDWLLARTADAQGFDVMNVLTAAAAGCDLPTLQRLHRTYLDSRGEELDEDEQGEVMKAAAGSPTADWRDKVEWLERRGYPQDYFACMKAAQLVDGRERLQWLQQRGCSFSGEVAYYAAAHGNADVLEFLLELPQQRVLGECCWNVGATYAAAQGGHLAALKVLHAHGAHVDGDGMVLAAALGGHLPVVAWLAETLGAAVVLKAHVFADAAKSGNAELLAWLHERGCPWDASVFAAAAAIGSGDQLEWLVEHGCPMGQQQAQQLQPDAVPGAADPSRIWLPEVVHHFARFLGGNELAATLRLVNKATAAQFPGPQHTTIRLSLPVPHHAFVWRWGGPNTTRSLTVRQRQQLPCLTARSGSISNLEVLLPRDDLTSPVAAAVLEAAAGAGQLEACRWLRQLGCPLDDPLTMWEAAAGRGHRAVCEWLLDEGDRPADVWAASAAAARGGHVDLMDWLLARTAGAQGSDVPNVLAGAAAGCDLPTLQRLHHTYLDSQGRQLPKYMQNPVVAAAAGSPMSDWQDKVKWLEGLSCRRTAWVCMEAAKRVDGQERLEWLQQRGYPLTSDVLREAAAHGNVDALEFLMAQGVELVEGLDLDAITQAVEGGHLAALKVLHAHGAPDTIDSITVAEAAESGQLPMVAWLVETLGTAEALTEDVFAFAARSGNAELLAWLHERGCPWDASVFTDAAAFGSEEQVEWLAEHGCPMAAQQLQANAVPDTADPSRIWLPEVVQRFAGFLGGNELAATLRLIDKATAAQFQGPQHTTIRLSLPVPHHAFVWRWGGPITTRSLTVRQRQQLPCLTARSGSIANLGILLPRDDLTSPVAAAVLEAAAGAGQLEVCRWLRQQGCPLDKILTMWKAAAGGGHQAVCEWLLGEGDCPSDVWAASAFAAHGGHVGLMDWLLERTAGAQGSNVQNLLAGTAAGGCDLRTLQRLHHTYLDSQGGQLSEAGQVDIMAYTAGSPTADWRDKMEWLEGRGYPRPVHASMKAAQLVDSRERLEWLQRRGYPLTAVVVCSAAAHGRTDALDFLLAQGVGLLDEGLDLFATSQAAEGGHLAALKVLHAHGARGDHQATPGAALGGYLPVVAWLVETLGATVALTVKTFARAAESGNAELLAWLHERGCPWDASVFAAAAAFGSEEQLEWLVEHGCPMGRAQLQPPQQQQQQREQRPGAASDTTSSDGPPRIWLPEVVQHFASFLTDNELAATLRLTNKATAAQFREPQHATVQLSLPVPHHAFAWRWGGPDATRSLTVLQREELPCLTARSGSISNLEVLLARDDRSSPLKAEVLAAAAGAGQLEVCRWLRQQGCPMDDPFKIWHAEAVAAGGGHRAVCEWLLDEGDRPADVWVAAAASARSGHVDLMDWLLERTAGAHKSNVPDLLAAAAAGCDLLTLQRLHHTYLDTQLAGFQQGKVLFEAAGSPTVDWRDKVEWLEGRGCPRTAWVCMEAAQRVDSRERLEWLQQRGYPLTSDLLREAAAHGNVDALEFLLAQGVELGEVDDDPPYDAPHYAASGGHLAALKVLHAHGAPLDDGTVAAAAGGGHLPVVAWLVETLGAAEALAADVFANAAMSGNAELLAWLHEHGCPWDASVFTNAARWGSEEQLEWLAERGCPMESDAEPYRWAVENADLAMLRCLRRLGCPWGPAGRTFGFAIEACTSQRSGFAPRPRKQRLLVLTWLVDQGCPVYWGKAERKAEKGGDSEVLAWCGMGAGMGAAAPWVEAVASCNGRVAH
ncbi:Ankyrin repeat domain-containing protein [Tetrabaena socialis]|uniref:Ankyrin repeat domain-containing protein n=1 Tax=Tetrabaena socialis TaxID=47790 RepID=A0A2J7ZW21_9CHLO|nr:Ankyrin repeat domain-containing protein [Tetrabaena socialis]|eukprot:PNH04454.1 Ankyrin repeat domain-containing protein [Tetrabaena socialis]